MIIQYFEKLFELEHNMFIKEHIFISN